MGLKNKENKTKKTFVCSLTSRPIPTNPIPIAYEPATIAQPQTITLPITTLDHILQAPESQVSQDDPRPHCEAKFSHRISAISLLDPGACVNLAGSYFYTLIAEIL